MDQWLVRTAQNQIAGPYSKEQVCHLVLQGHIGYQDEICQANGYWIHLHEREEVLEALGVEVPRRGRLDEDITETQIETLEQRAAASAHAGGAGAEGADHPTVMMRAADANAPAAAPRIDIQVSAAPRPPGAPRPRPKIPAKVIETIERPSFLRGFTWLLICALVLILWAVMRTSRLG